MNCKDSYRNIDTNYSKVILIIKVIPYGFDQTLISNSITLINAVFSYKF